MSWDYINKSGVRLKGTSNGYFVLSVEDELTLATATVDIDAPEFLKELGQAFLKAAEELKG